MPIAPASQCLAAAFSRAGYRSLYTGRWPLGPGSPAQHGFDLWTPSPPLNGPFFLHVHNEPLPALPPGTLVAAVSLAPDSFGRVALSVRWPLDIPRDRLISQVDIMPTILALCGVPVPPRLHGRDLAAVRAESVFTYGALGSAAEWRTVIRGLDKLTVNAALEPVALYNLGQDPLESQNLAFDTSFVRTRDELFAHLMQWLRRIEYGVDPSGLRLRN